MPSSRDGVEVVIYTKNWDSRPLYQRVMDLMRMRVRYYQCMRDEEDESYRQYVLSGGEITDFMNDTQLCMEWFNVLGPSIVTIDHSGKKKDYVDAFTTMTYNDLIRLQVIIQFLKICSQYIDLLYYPDCNINIKSSCYSCGEPIGRMVDDEWTCDCGYVTYRCRDSRSDTKGESEYRPEVTFVKECIYFQGKEGLPLPTDLFGKLDGYMATISLSREWILNQPYDQYGKRIGTSVRLMITALKAIGCHELYKRVNYIGREYCGWILYDLDDDMDDIMDIYRRTQEAYKLIPRVRKSNISTQGTLLRILEIIGRNVNEKDFKLCTTRDSKEECEYLWREMCRIADVPYYRHF